MRHLVQRCVEIWFVFRRAWPEKGQGVNGFDQPRVLEGTCGHPSAPYTEAPKDLAPRWLSTSVVMFVLCGTIGGLCWSS